MIESPPPTLLFCTVFYSRLSWQSRTTWRCMWEPQTSNKIMLDFRMILQSAVGNNNSLVVCPPSPFVLHLKKGIWGQMQPDTLFWLLGGRRFNSSQWEMDADSWRTRCPGGGQLRHLLSDNKRWRITSNMENSDGLFNPR